MILTLWPCQVIFRPDIFSVYENLSGCKVDLNSVLDKIFRILQHEPIILKCIDLNYSLK